MGKSFKTQAFRAFVRKAMKKYVGDEQAYIDKRLAGQDFDERGFRKSDYKAPEGFSYKQFIANGVPAEELVKIDTHPIVYKNRKIIYVLHGGAYHASMTDLYCGVMERYSEGKYDVFAIDYRTAPKDVFPGALEDAIRGYEYLVNRGYDPANIFVAGDSAGGGLALAMALQLARTGADIPKKYILSSPWVDLSARYSEDQKRDDVLFGWGKVLEMCAKRYADGGHTTNPLVSPLFGNMEVFKGCDFYISVAKGEMLMAQGEVIAAKLKNANARVTLDVLDSGVHDVITMYALNSRECRYAWSRINQFISRFMKY